MDQRNKSIIEITISSRKVQRRLKRAIALMAVFVLLLTTDSLKMMANTLESDAALDQVSALEAVEAEQMLFDVLEEDEELPALEDDEAVSAEEEAVIDDFDEAELDYDVELSSEDGELSAEELEDVSIEETYEDEADAELFLDYEEAEDILYAVSTEGAGFRAEVSCDTGVTLPTGTTLAAQWTETVEGRSGAVAQLCEALGVAGNTLPANMGAAFMDMALLNGGAVMQPAGGVYVNIDFTEPLRIEGSEPVFRVVTLDGGVARVIDESNYGVTLDGGDVTALWYYCDIVTKTALVWDVVPVAAEEPAGEIEVIEDVREEEPAVEEEEDTGIDEIIDEPEDGGDNEDIPETEEPEETETTEENDGAEDSEVPEDADETEDSDESKDADEPEDSDDPENADEAEESEETGEAEESEETGETEDSDESEDVDETGDSDESEDTDEAEDSDEPGNADETENSDESEDADETEETDETESADEPGDAEGEPGDEVQEDAVEVSGSLNGIHVTVRGDVPAEAVPVAELLMDGEDHDSVAGAIEAMADAEAAQSALAFDIALVYNNEKIQPDGPVDVTVALDAPFSVREDEAGYRLVDVRDGVAAALEGAEVRVEDGALTGFAYTTDCLAPVAVVSGSAIPAVEAVEPTEEPAEEAAEPEAAAEPLRLGIATVTTAEGEGLPAEAEGHAEIIDGEDAIASVQAFLNGARRAKMAARAAEPVESETRYTVLDIDVSNVEAEGYRVDVTLPEAIEARDFRLFHIHDDVEEIAVTLYDAEGGEVDPAAASAVAGFSFVTESFSPFVLQYTVDIAQDEGRTIVNIDFADFDAAAVADAESALALLNDGVSIRLSDLMAAEAEEDEEDEDGQRRFHTLTVGCEAADEAIESLENYEVAESEGEVGYADGCLAVRGNGSVTLSDGEREIIVNITGYTELLADVVEGDGVRIEVLEGSVPAGSEATFAAHDEAQTAELVSAYIEGEDEAANTGYAAFDVSIQQPEGDLYAEEGQFQVAVTPDIDVDSLVPAGAKLADVRYTVYHIHDGEATEVPAEVAEDGALVFTTDSFSDFVVSYTVDFHYDVDGETYEYTLTGGEALSLRALVEALHVLDGEAEAVEPVEDAEDAEDAEGEEAPAGAVAPDYDAFVANIADVTFSDEALVKPVPVTEDTTAGELKAQYALQPEYSAELTAAQIAELDAQAFTAPDWALVSLKAFDTEETLTVTMQNGDSFQIRVTDSNFASTVDGKTFALIIANSAKTSGSALDSTVRSDGRLTSRTTAINYLGETVNEEVYFCDNSVNTINWTFEYIKGSGNQFYLKANNGQYLHYDGSRFSLSNEPTVLYADVTPGDNDHVRLCIDAGLTQAINLYDGNDGNNGNGFAIWGLGNNDPNELFTLCVPYNMDSSNLPGTISTVDNNVEGIELKLFDYDYIETPGTTGELDKQGNKVEGKNGNAHYNQSVNQGKKLWFLGWGADSDETNPGINDFTGLGSNIRALQGIVQNNLVNGYPVLAVDQDGNVTNESLAYLFDGTAADTNTYTANHLFEKIGDKYSYDSNKHYAEFNKQTGNFTVYNGTLEQTGKRTEGFNTSWVRNDKAVGFFPFDSYSNMKGLYDNNRLYLNPDISENDQKKKNGQHYRMNHHNGMSLETHFRLPEGGQDSYGNDIEFEFSGDDDLWVYIDDVLVLDIGGVHQPLNGKINFTTGEVTVDAAVTADGADSQKAAGASTTIEEMFRKAGKVYDPNKLHEMKVFWIERGGCDSNCKIEFNLPLTTTKEAGAITFNKASARNQSLMLEGAVFTLYTDAACTTPLTIGNVPVTATSDKNGYVNFYAIPTGTYYIKETTYPEGYQAKTPEEVFTVTVVKDTTVKPRIGSTEYDPVLNEPKKIDVEVEKVWQNGIIPKNASIDITLGRYKLVEDPNAQGTGTIVIKDSYTGLPSGSTYQVTYTITGPDNYSNTIRQTYADSSKNIEISVPDVPAGVQYTVTKSVDGITAYSIGNQTGSTTVTVPKKGSVDAQFAQSTFSKSAYRVRVYAVNKQDWNQLEQYSSADYPAGSSLSIRLEHNAYNWGFFSFTVSSNTGWNSEDYTNDSAQQFTNNLQSDIDLYVRCSNSDWTKGYDWIKNPTISGASPVSANASTRMMAARQARALSQTAAEPTLPTPPKDTLYVPDEEYALDPDVITLNAAPWKGTATGLDAYNDYGPYVYYIASVDETGLPQGTEMTIANEVSMDGSLQVLTVTNDVPPLGNLQITKNIQTNGTLDSGRTGTFYYAVYSEEYNASADPPQTPVKTGSIEVTAGGTKTVTVSDLLYGTYYVYELDGEDGTPITGDGTIKAISGQPYKVTGSGSQVTVPPTGAPEGTPAAATLNNDVETVTVSITKQWDDGNNNSRPASLEVTLSNGDKRTLNASNNWTATISDLPKYDNAGEVIPYSWSEEQLPAGYYLSGYEESTDPSTGIIATTLTNSYSDQYNPKTVIKGKKIWDDDNSPNRPNFIKVQLYADGVLKEEKTVTAQTGEGANPDEWPFEFTNLPVFNADGSLIQYTVEEVLPEDYISVYGVNIEFEQATYIPGTITGEVVNSGQGGQIFEVSEGVELGYIVIRHGNDFIIWTPRPATFAEITAIKKKVVALSDQFNGIKTASGSSLKIVSGVPCTVDVGKKHAVSLYMRGEEVWMEFLNPNAWSDFAYGKILYTYTQAGGEGGGTIKNTRKVTDITGTKTWFPEGTHDNASDVTLKLTRTYTVTEEETTTAKTETATVVDEALTWVEIPDENAKLYQPVWNGNTYTYAGLQKFTNDTMQTEYTYSVVEAKFKVGNTWYTVTKGEGDTFTVIPQYKYKVTQTGNDIVNEELTEIDVTKQWKQGDKNKVFEEEKAIGFTLYYKYEKPAPEGEEGDTVTVTDIYTGYNGNGKGTVTYTPAYPEAEPPVASGWSTAHISGLPKRMYVEEDAAWYDVTYYVVEDESTVSNVAITYLTDAQNAQATGTAADAAVSGGTITIINTDKETSLTVTKTWKLDGEALTTGQIVEYEITYKVMVSDTGAEGTWEDYDDEGEDADTYTMTWTAPVAPATEPTIQNNVVTGLPAGKQYKAVETEARIKLKGIDDEITLTFSDPREGETEPNNTSGPFTTTFENEIPKTKITLVKMWSLNGNPATEDIPEELAGDREALANKVQVTLYRVNGEQVAIDSVTGKPVASGSTATKYTIPRVPKADGTGYEWKLEINNLDKYHWDEDVSKFVPYKYYVNEDDSNLNSWHILTYEGDEGPKNSGAASDATTTEGTITITNSKYTVKLPSTGGAGTNALYATGAGLLVLAALWFIWDQRRRYRADI